MWRKERTLKKERNSFKWPIWLLSGLLHSTHTQPTAHFPNDKVIIVSASLELQFFCERILKLLYLHFIVIGFWLYDWLQIDPDELNHYNWRLIWEVRVDLSFLFYLPSINITILCKHIHTFLQEFFWPDQNEWEVLKVDLQNLNFTNPATTQAKEEL